MIFWLGGDAMAHQVMIHETRGEITDDIGSTKSTAVSDMETSFRITTQRELVQFT